MRRHTPFDTFMYPLWLVASVAFGIWMNLVQLDTASGRVTIRNITDFSVYALVIYTSVLGIASFTRRYWPIVMLAILAYWGFFLYLLLAWIPYTAGESTLQHITKDWKAFAFVFVIGMVPAAMFYWLCRFSPRQLMAVKEEKPSGS
ncbi:MAG: hypothetical protein ACYC1M_07975 [Armatimonadota bacterium]